MLDKYQISIFIFLLCIFYLIYTIYYYQSENFLVGNCNPLDNNGPLGILGMNHLERGDIPNKLKTKPRNFNIFKGIGNCHNTNGLNDKIYFEEESSPSNLIYNNTPNINNTLSYLKDDSDSNLDDDLIKYYSDLDSSKGCFTDYKDLPNIEMEEDNLSCKPKLLPNYKVSKLKTLYKFKPEETEETEENNYKMKSSQNVELDEEQTNDYEEYLSTQETS